MFDFKSDATTKAEIWADILSAAKAVTAGEADAIANMANVSAILFHGLPDLNWAGFYRMVQNDKGGGELVLGPFQGKAACIRIPLGKGVCGVAAATGKTQLVEDVHAFPGHIACDADSRSELVVPLVHDGQVIGVIDLDSPLPVRFDNEDAAGCEALARLIGPNLGQAVNHRT
jgi:L-methionine (R)-S-oxide reductase